MSRPYAPALPRGIVTFEGLEEAPSHFGEALDSAIRLTTDRIAATILSARCLPGEYDLERTKALKALAYYSPHTQQGGEFRVAVFATCSPRSHFWRRIQDRFDHSSFVHIWAPVRPALIAIRDHLAPSTTVGVEYRTMLATLSNHQKAVLLAA